MTDQLYLYRHRFLHMLWHSSPNYFITLTYRQQRALHDYYRPASELTDDELLQHRVLISNRRPNLPAEAGKAFRQMERTYLEATKTSGGDPDRLRSSLDRKVRYSRSSPGTKGRRLKVASLVQPELDLSQLAQVLVDVAMDIAARDHEAPTEDDRHDEAA